MTTTSAQARRPSLAPAFLACVLLSVAWTSTSRHLAPLGDQFAPYPPGGADLSMPFNGARALLAGANPYHHDLPWLQDPWGRWRALPFQQLYPPSHSVLYVPLVVMTGGEHRAAARLFFVMSLALLGALAWGVVSVARRQGAPVTDEQASLLAGLLCLAMAASPAGTMLLERGQSDHLLALCTWAGAWLCLRGQAGRGVFLLSVGVLCKGYAVLAGGGILLLTLLDPRTRRGGAGGLAVAAAVLLLPVARYLSDAIEAMRFMAGPNHEAAYWFNHGFGNLAGWFEPSLERPGRLALASASLAATGACFLRLARVWRTEAEEARVLWSTLFVTCALTVMIGWNPASFSYDLFFLFPGLLLLGLLQERLPVVTGARRAVTSTLLLAALACTLVGRGPSLTFPLPAVGLCAVVALGLVCGGAATSSAAPRA